MLDLSVDMRAKRHDVVLLFSELNNMGKVLIKRLRLLTSTGSSACR